jgi:hypothetical protein
MRDPKGWAKPPRSRGNPSRFDTTQPARRSLRFKGGHEEIGEGYGQQNGQRID